MRRRQTQFIVQSNLWVLSFMFLIRRFTQVTRCSVTLAASCRWGQSVSLLLLTRLSFRALKVILSVRRGCRFSRFRLTVKLRSCRRPFLPLKCFRVRVLFPLLLLMIRPSHGLPSSGYCRGLIAGITRCRRRFRFSGRLVTLLLWLTTRRTLQVVLVTVRRLPFHLLTFNGPVGRTRFAKIILPVRGVAFFIKIGSGRPLFPFARFSVKSTNRGRRGYWTSVTSSSPRFRSRCLVQNGRLGGRVPR